MAFPSSFAIALITPFVLGLTYFSPAFAHYTSLLLVAPFLWWLMQAKTSPIRVFFLSWLCGGIFFAITLHWLFATLPLDWAGIQSTVQGFTVFFAVWLIIVAAFALGWGAFGVGTFLLVRRWNSSLLLFLSIPALWVMSEYARSFVFALVWFSEGQSLLGPHWTFSDLGYMLADSPFNLLARFGGLPLLNFFLIFVNLAVVWMAQHSFAKRYAAGILGSTILLGIVIWGIDRVVFLSPQELASQKEISVAALNFDFPKRFYFSPGEQEDKRAAIVQAISAIEKPVDVIVLPEISEFVSAKMYNEELLRANAVLSRALVVDHNYIIENDISSPYAMYWRSDQGMIARQGKLLIMPGGEYLPWLLRQGLYFFGRSELITAYDAARSVYYSPKQPAVSDRLGTFSSLLCSEIMSPDIVRQGAVNGVQLFFLQTSDAIFQGNAAYLAQMMAMAKLRAVESGRFIVRSSNGGNPAIIDPYGNAVTFPKGKQIMYGYPRLIEKQTWYTSLGSLPWVALAFLAVAGSFIWKKKP